MSNNDNNQDTSRLIRKEMVNAVKICRKLFYFGLFIAFGLYLASGIYTIKTNELGIHHRLGKVINPRVQAGIHFALPYPFDRVDKIPSLEVLSLKLGFWDPGLDAPANSKIAAQQEKLLRYCITADRNILHLLVTLRYTVADPVKYFYHLPDGLQKQFLEGVAESVIILVLANEKIMKVFTTQKLTIEKKIVKLLQQRLESMEAGLLVTGAELTKVSPPAAVKDAFADVNNAQIDCNTLIHGAEDIQNQNLARARSRSKEILHNARINKYQRIKEASAQVASFNSIIKEYHKKSTTDPHPDLS